MANSSDAAQQQEHAAIENIALESADDGQLVKLVAEGEERAMECLLSRHKALVIGLVRPYFLAGAGSDDLIQEGMIGLYKAVSTYNPDGAAGFATYAAACIKSKIFDAIKNANRNKNKVLNEYVSLCLLSSEEAATLRSPEDIAIEREGYESLTAKINSRLCESERLVLKYFINGVPYRDIATKLGKNTKFVDNTLQKIRKKLAVK